MSTWKFRWMPVLLTAAATVFSSPGAYAQYQNRAAQARYQQRTAQSPAVAGETSAQRAGVGTSARPVAAGASLAGMQKALSAFALDMGRMPTGAEGLNALLYPPPGAKNWRGPYISTTNWRAAFTDPWGSQYRYVVQGTGRQAVHYILSNGPDRAANTRDDLSVQF